MANQPSVTVYAGEELARYGFGDDHPFGPDRFDAFWREFTKRGLHHRVQVASPVQASREAIERFHTANYVSKVKTMSQTGAGYLDHCDTPAFVGAYEAAAFVAGSVLDALERIIQGECKRAFVPHCRAAPRTP